VRPKFRDPHKEKKMKDDARGERFYELGTIINQVQEAHTAFMTLCLNHVVNPTHQRLIFQNAEQALFWATRDLSRQIKELSNDPESPRRSGPD